MKDIYDAAIKALPETEIDHHETDLYLKVSPESEKLVENYDYKFIVEKFRSPLDGCLWFDIPFAYTPEWIEHAKKNDKRTLTI